ncbi:plasmid recombination protein [Coprococcus comes]|nr:plasmid recombination protein [Coprococcus comes]
MAGLKKFTLEATKNLIRHNQRTIKNPANVDIDSLRTINNYTLHPDRGISDYKYFVERKAQLYCYNRTDVKVAAGWIVTKPKDFPQEKQREFFKAVYCFLNERYGAENCIQAIVHNDESGQPHLHYVFIPVTKDLKHGGEKICANAVLNKEELRSFHPDLQKYLLDHGIKANVINGITQKNGGNKSVWQMKQERQREREYERAYTVERNSRW